MVYPRVAIVSIVFEPIMFVTRNVDRFARTTAQINH
ncbi:MAG: hypothetical protein ACI9HK_001577 [Pirellulaceae bacterium]|jgi:hypothetical protein